MIEWYRIRSEIIKVVEEKRQAIRDQNYELASKLRDEEKRLYDAQEKLEHRVSVIDEVLKN